MKNKQIKYSVATLILFYMIGAAGFIFPGTRQFFSGMTPLTLILSAGFLIWFHRPGVSLKMLLIFGVIFVSSFFIEVAGVKTGLIFGAYSYGKGLGTKLFDTPLIIGLNWLMLVYCTKIIAEKIFKSKPVRLFFAPTLMVIYDLALEQVAPSLGMWTWSEGAIPFQNFIAWFLLSLLFHLLLQKSKTRFSNKLAAPVFIIQFLFFVILIVYFLVIKT